MTCPFCGKTEADCECHKARYELNPAEAMTFWLDTPPDGTLIVRWTRDPYGDLRKWQPGIFENGHGEEGALG